MTLICLDPCQWSLMSLITGNKVKKTHKPRYSDFLKFVFILFDIGPAPRNSLLDPLNFCRTYIFYVKLF